MSKIKMVKPGIMTLNIGTAVIRKLQEALNYIGKDLTQQDMDEYSELFKKGTAADKYPKEWMKHLYNISFLIKMCEDAADTQNLTYEKDVDANYTSIEDLFKPE